MRTLVGIACAVVVGACLPAIDVSPPDGGFPFQATYTYPDCSESGPSTCPNAGTFECALFQIAQKYDPCQLDVDCVGVYTNDCLGFSDCHPVAVNRLNVDAFSAEAAAEVLGYCGDGGVGPICTRRGDCAGFWDGPFCRDGRCFYRLQGGDI